MNEMFSYYGASFPRGAMRALTKILTCDNMKKRAKTSAASDHDSQLRSNLNLVTRDS